MDRIPGTKLDMASKKEDVDLDFDEEEESQTNTLKEVKSTSMASFMLRNKSAHVSTSFTELTEELTSNSIFSKLSERDVDAIFTYKDWIKYRLDLFVASNPDSRFLFLILCTLIMMMVLAAIWTIIKHDKELKSTYSTFLDAFYMTFLVTTTGDYNVDVERSVERFIFGIIVLLGIIVTAVLIGIVTDTMSSAMAELASGKSKVVEENHTLILGWNESTPRLVCQVAFLRRVFRVQNETLVRQLFPWLRVLPSSPVALNSVVIMANNISKEKMEDILKKAFSEAKVRSRRTKIGRDVLIRKGDPTTTHDLLRVSAQNATSIAIMMTESDENESKLSNGRISNSASIRTVLALRNVMYSNGDPVETFDPDCRIIVQLQRPCRSLSAAAFLAPSGMEVMFPLDLHDFINTLLFKCVAKPGLSRVVSSLLDFECEAIRCRQASQLKAGKNYTVGFFIGKTVRQAMLEHWWGNGVVIGVDSPRSADYDKYNADGTCGITNNPSRVICPDDWIIFVSPSSSPSFGSHGDHKKFVEHAEVILSESGKGRPRRLSGTNFGVNSAKPKHVLLCGWRPEWHSSPKSFRERIRSICDDLTPDSTITCLNVTSVTDFHKLMVFKTESESCDCPDPLTGRPAGYAEDSAWPVDPEKAENDDHSKGWRITEESGDRTFTVYHAWGDPVNYTCVSWLFHDPNTPAFDAAIALGNVVGGDIPPDARDSRVLSMLLILRELSSTCPIGSKKYEGRLGMHMIVENCVDQTAILAVCPKRTVKGQAENDVSVAGTVLSSYSTSKTRFQKAAEMASLKKAVLDISDEQMEAIVEVWAPAVVVIDDENFESESTLVAQVLGGWDGYVKKLKVATKKDKVIKAGKSFIFTDLKIVRATPQDGSDSVKSAIFYKLNDGGWVHDFSPEDLGRRTIKVNMTDKDGIDSVPEPDFVNSQAIIARTMAMTLAYPQIQASVMELVSTQAGTPEVELFSPEVIGVPINEDWAGGSRKLCFGVMQYLLDNLYNGYAVAVGYILASDGLLVLSPDPGSSIAWYRNDRIVAIIRHDRRENCLVEHVHNEDRPRHTFLSIVNSLKTVDGSHATFLSNGKQASQADVNEKNVASVVRQTMQPTPTLDAVLEQQRRSDIAQQEMLREMKELKAQVVALANKK
jgi:hypothetical protein